MKRFNGLFIALFAILVLLPMGGAHAQTYSFSVPREQIDAFWEADGSLTLLYNITFDNFADPLDFVDIGLPNNNYSLGNVSAAIDGRPITDIEDSPYVTYGPALGLGANAIPSGQSGTVTVVVTGIRDVLFVDEEDASYASAVFSPNFFGSEFVGGSTDLILVYHLPPGVDPAEPKWHPAPSGFPSEPQTGFDADGRITYTWRNTSASPSSFYLFGASFPQSYVPVGTVAEPTSFDFSNPVPGGFDSDAIIGFVIFACVCLFFVGITWIAIVADRRQKMRYLPPKIAIEGNGIKRGLTAPEAAILLEEPMDKVVTMMLFSVLRKEAASVTKRDPLELEIADPLPLHLREYETLFLEAFLEKGKVRHRKALQKMMVKLVKSVANKMKGFSKKETVAYYRSIVDEAWQQVESADTPEVKSEKFEEELEWTMLDKDYDRRTREVFTDNVYVPRWWGRYDPTFGRASSSRPISTAGKGSSVPNLSTGSGKVSLPTLPGGDFASSMVTGVQNMSAGVLGSLSDFTGGVTKVTNPPPKTSSRSSGGFSGGGSSCACACAGCACACAGGGR
jgi:hypothetical protein